MKEGILAEKGGDSIAVSYNNLRLWLSRAKPEVTYMSIIRNSFDCDDDSVLVRKNQDILKETKDYDNMDISGVMGVIRPGIDIDAYLAEY